MTHPNLGDELLKATGISILPPEQQVAEMLHRGSRSVRRLTWLVVILWALTIPMVGLLVLYSYSVGKRNENVRSQYERELREKKPSLKDWSPEQLALLRALYMEDDNVLAVGFLAIAITVLGLLSLGTIVLVHSSRKITLRQIAVSLQTLSEQVKQIHSASLPG
jgi:hypothetical protein